MHKRKRIYLDNTHDKYLTVYLYAHLKDMREAYHKFRPNDVDHEKVFGVHCGFDRLFVYEDGSEKCLREIARVFLYFDGCGVGVVSHELGHGALWAFRHTCHKEQYPIVINNMEEEEELLHMQTYAVAQFYRWYWKIEKHFKLK